MKDKTKLFGAMRSIAIIALVAVIGFSMAACKNDSDDDSTIRYTSVDSSLNIYELEITEGRAAATGDSYTLSIYRNSGDTIGKSSGTITVAGNEYTLSKGGTVTISGGAMTKIDGTITLDSGGTHSGTGDVTSVKDGGDGSANGTWKKESTGEVVTFKGSSFTYKGEGITAPGTATYGGDIMVTYGTQEGYRWIVAGRYTLSGNTITFTGFSGTYGQYYSGEWVKQ